MFVFTIRLRNDNHLMFAHGSVRERNCFCLSKAIAVSLFYNWLPSSAIGVGVHVHPSNFAMASGHVHPSILLFLHGYTIPETTCRNRNWDRLNRNDTNCPR